MTSGSVFVKWRGYHETLTSAFQNHLRENFLVDCTLAAEGQNLKAHKVILSGCSPYFKMLFNETQDEHPVIILMDVEYKYLKAMVDFVYNGEVEICKNELILFLEIARSLQIGGLESLAELSSSKTSVAEMSSPVTSASGSATANKQWAAAEKDTEMIPQLQMSESIPQFPEVQTACRGSQVLRSLSCVDISDSGAAVTDVDTSSVTLQSTLNESNLSPDLNSIKTEIEPEEEVEWLPLTDPLDLDCFEVQRGVVKPEGANSVTNSDGPPFCTEIKSNSMTGYVLSPPDSLPGHITYSDKTNIVLSPEVIILEDNESNTKNSMQPLQSGSDMLSTDTTLEVEIHEDPNSVSCEVTEELRDVAIRSDEPNIEPNIEPTQSGENTTDGNSATSCLDVTEIELQKKQSSVEETPFPIPSCVTVDRASSLPRSRVCVVRLEQLDVATAVASGLSLATVKEVLRRTTKKSSDPKRKFTCRICRKAFRKSFSLKEHMRIHSQEELLQSREVSAAAVGQQHTPSQTAIGNPQDVEQHSLAPTPTTTGEQVLPNTSVQGPQKKNFCRLCGMIFVSPSKLKDHMRLHRERPFKCHICKFRFAVKWSLINHLHAHFRARPFKCDHCGVGFTWQTALKTHLRLHSGEETSQGPECDR